MMTESIMLHSLYRTFQFEKENKYLIPILICPMETTIILPLMVQGLHISHLHLKLHWYSCYHHAYNMCQHSLEKKGPGFKRLFDRGKDSDKDLPFTGLSS